MRNGKNNDQNLEAPPRLVSALRQLPQEQVFVPSAVDESLIKAARRQLATSDKRKRQWFGLMPWTVATAGFAAIVLVAYPFAKQFLGFEPSNKSVQRGLESRTGIEPEIHRFAHFSEDVNGDGKVDILDAFVLAKKLQAAPGAPNFDVNQDGFVDQRDVETIAAHAVSLEKRGRS